MGSYMAGPGFGAPMHSDRPWMSERANQQTAGLSPYMAGPVSSAPMHSGRRWISEETHHETASMGGRHWMNEGFNHGITGMGPNTAGTNSGVSTSSGRRWMSEGTNQDPFGLGSYMARPSDHAMHPMASDAARNFGLHPPGLFMIAITLPTPAMRRPDAPVSSPAQGRQVAQPHAGSELDRKSLLRQLERYDAATEHRNFNKKLSRGHDLAKSAACGSSETPKIQQDPDDLDPERFVCVVCRCAVRSMIFEPCRHLVCCADCGARHPKGGHQCLEKCPICREEIIRRTRIFLA